MRRPRASRLYMFQKPKTAKRLYFDVIPKAVDEYYPSCPPIRNSTGRTGSAIPSGTFMTATRRPSTCRCRLRCFSILSAHRTRRTSGVLWGFISRYAPGVTPQTHPELDRLAGYAIRYFDDFVKPAKSYRAPDAAEREALAKLSDALAALPTDADAEAIQNAALNVARKIDRYQDQTKQSPEGGPGVSVAFFQMIYQVLLGQERGPRFGSFAALYGIEETQALIANALSGELV